MAGKPLRLAEAFLRRDEEYRFNEGLLCSAGAERGDEGWSLLGSERNTCRLNEEKELKAEFFSRY